MKRSWPFALKPDVDDIISIASSEHERPESIPDEFCLLEVESEQEYFPTTPSDHLPCNITGTSLDRAETGSFDPCFATTPVLNGGCDGGRVYDREDTDDFAGFGFMKSGVMSFRDLCTDICDIASDITDITGTIIEATKVHVVSGADTVHRSRKFYDLPPFRFRGPGHGVQGDGDAAGGPPSLPTTPPSITSGEVDPQDFEDLPGPPIPTPDSDYYDPEDDDGRASDSRDSMDRAMHEFHDEHLPIVLPPPDMHMDSVGAGDHGGRPPHGSSTSGECRTCVCIRRCPTCGRELRLPRVVRFG